MYKLLYDTLSNKDYGSVKANEDGSFTSFLFNPDNTDYQEYLKWLAEGNTPLPAENE